MTCRTTAAKWPASVSRSAECLALAQGLQRRVRRARMFSRCGELSLSSALASCRAEKSHVTFRQWSIYVENCGQWRGRQSASFDYLSHAPRVVGAVCRSSPVSDRPGAARNAFSRLIGDTPVRARPLAHLTQVGRQRVTNMAPDLPAPSLPPSVFADAGWVC